MLYPLRNQMEVLKKKLQMYPMDPNGLKPSNHWKTELAIFVLLRGSGQMNYLLFVHLSKCLYVKHVFTYLHL